MAPTKAELLDLADKHNVTVEPKATNAQITDALQAAGVELNDGPAQRFSAGDVVRFTYKDAAANDVVRFGTVVEVVDNHNAATDEQTSQGTAEALPGARVAWLGDVSDPIPFDQLERHGDSR